MTLDAVIISAQSFGIVAGLLAIGRQEGRINSLESVLNTQLENRLARMEDKLDALAGVRPWPSSTEHT